VFNFHASARRTIAGERTVTACSIRGQEGCSDAVFLNSARIEPGFSIEQKEGLLAEPFSFSASATAYAFN
jgi:hypothetical protein